MPMPKMGHVRDESRYRANLDEVSGHVAAAGSHHGFLHRPLRRVGQRCLSRSIEGELDRADTLIPLKWFYEQLAKCKARQKVLVLDGNRYNRAFGQERPGGEEMGPKLDAMLKEPPAGVQVWSSCIAKQRSFATDDYPMGIFLDSLLVALRRGGEGKIQGVEEAMPLDRYVEPVNKLIKDDLSKRKLEQVSRLTGKEADSGAAYDPNQPWRRMP